MTVVSRDLLFTCIGILTLIGLSLIAEFGSEICAWVKNWFRCLRRCSFSRCDPKFLRAYHCISGYMLSFSPVYMESDCLLMGLRLEDSDPVCSVWLWDSDVWIVDLRVQYDKFFFICTVRFFPDNRMRVFVLLDLGFPCADHIMTFPCEVSVFDDRFDLIVSDVFTICNRALKCKPGDSQRKHIRKLEKFLYSRTYFVFD